MKTILKALLLCSIICVGFAPASFAQAQRRRVPQVMISGVYGSLQVGSVSGDIGGMLIYITEADGMDFYATVQEAQGVVGDPVLVKIQVKGANIDFALEQSGSPARRFTGRITTAGLTLMETGGERMFLKRKCTYR